MSDNYEEIPDSEPMIVMEAAAEYYTPFQNVYVSRRGVDPHFVIDLMELYHFTKQEMAHLTDISTKTLDRNLQSGPKFQGLQSDRLLQLAELFHEGVDVFGSKDKFLKWLNAKIPALGNTAPKEWLDTHRGIMLISDELGRIKHGIFA